MGAPSAPRTAHEILSTTTPSSTTNCSDQNDLLSALYDKPKDANKNKNEFEIYLKYRSDIAKIQLLKENRKLVEVEFDY